MVEERVTELEMRYTLQQDLIRQLSEVVLEQGREIKGLRHELDSLRSRNYEPPIALSVEEKPPHY